MSEADTKPVTFLDRWTRLSLARRIILAAAVWGLIVLIGGALALSALYRAQTLSLLSDDLDQTLITLTRDMTREGAFLPLRRLSAFYHSGPGAEDVRSGGGSGGGGGSGSRPAVAPPVLPRGSDGPFPYTCMTYYEDRLGASE